MGFDPLCSIVPTQEQTRRNVFRLIFRENYARNMKPNVLTNALTWYGLRAPNVLIEAVAIDRNT